MSEIFEANIDEDQYEHPVAPSATISLSLIYNYWPTIRPTSVKHASLHALPTIVNARTVLAVPLAVVTIGYSVARLRTD